MLPARSTGDRYATAISLFGLLSFAVLTAEVVAAIRRPGPLAALFVLGSVTTVPFAAVLLLAPRWLHGDAIPSERYPRIALWTAIGCVAFTAVNAAMIAVMPTGNRWIVVGWLRWAAVLGASMGFIVGYFEGHAIARAVEAERSQVRAAELEDRRELLDHLNAVLRHEVLNGANVIEGYADIVAESSTGETAERARIIERQAAELTSVTADVRLLLQSLEDAEMLQRVELTALIEGELSKLRDRHDGVDVRASIPDGPIHVVADDLLKRVFSNLLSNAVEHNDADEPTVAVNVDATPSAVEVEISDNGPGIPPEEREVLFEPRTARTDHGFGLTIVARLLERYGGSVSLVETGPEGTTFRARLPRASSEELVREGSSATDEGHPDREEDDIARSSPS